MLLANRSRADIAAAEGVAPRTLRRYCSDPAMVATMRRVAGEYQAAMLQQLVATQRERFFGDRGNEDAECHYAQRHFDRHQSSWSGVLSAEIIPASLI